MILEILEATDRLQEFGVAAFVLYSIYRELRWNPYEDRDDWRAVAVIALIGSISLVRTARADVDATDIALVAAALAIAATAGGLSARAAGFRPLTPATRTRLEGRPRRGRGAQRAVAIPRLEVRTGWVGVVLWVIALAGRYTIEAVAESVESPLAESAGLGLLVVATTEAVRVLVLRRRSPGEARSDRIQQR